MQSLGFNPVDALRIRFAYTGILGIGVTSEAEARRTAVNHKVGGVGALS
jgi:hypothetical protein